MVMTDPIADMLTRIRNANKMRHTTVAMPTSKLKTDIARVLKNEGYIADYFVAKEENQAQGTITLNLKYTETDERVIKGLKRISKPGLRVHAQASDIPRVFNGLGTAIISTSKGVMSDRDARKEKVGGEVLAYVW